MNQLPDDGVVTAGEMFEAGHGSAEVSCVELNQVKKEK